MAYPTLPKPPTPRHQHLHPHRTDQRLEHDIGEPLFHRATPDGRASNDPPGGELPYCTPSPGPTSRDSTRRPQDRTTRPQRRSTGFPATCYALSKANKADGPGSERFATTMEHDTISEAATTIGINRTTLIEQLHRLESNLGEPLYHRASADGEPQRPTNRGTGLLRILAMPDVQTLHARRTRLPRLPG